jgi:hypothetical protein
MCCSRPRAPISGEMRPFPLTAPVTPQRTRTGAIAARHGAPIAKAIFEYSGVTALTLVSPITRKTYRFEGFGARIEIDVRDRPWVAFVPKLSAVAAPDLVLRRTEYSSDILRE